MTCEWYFGLKGASKFKNFVDSLQINLVECSPALQKIQFQKLECMTEDVADGNANGRCISKLGGTPVSWHATLDQVPTGCKQSYCILIKLLL